MYVYISKLNFRSTTLHINFAEVWKWQNSVQKFPSIEIMCAVYIVAVTSERKDNHTWLPWSLGPEYFEDSVLHCEVQGEVCPIGPFVAADNLAGGVRETGCLAREPCNGLSVLDWGVTPTEDKGVFNGVLGVVGVRPTGPLLFVQLVWNVPLGSADVVQRATSGELDERFGVTTSMLLVVSITLCPTSSVTNSVLERSRVSVSELRDSTIVGRSVCFHLCWKKEEYDQSYLVYYELYFHMLSLIKMILCIFNVLLSSLWDTVVVSQQDD